MSNNNNHPLGEVPWLHVVLSTGLGTGFVPFAPGTAGALLALVIWIALYYILSPICLLWATLILIIGSFVLGIWTDNVMEKYWGEDPRAVVIDEFFGTWVAVMAATLSSGPDYLVIVLAFIAFCLFRIIDIFKPLGCRWVDEHIHGGLGCMLDDALAGFYAFILTMFIRHIHVIEYLHDTLYSSSMNTEYNLDRFLEAQNKQFGGETIYDIAYHEMVSGMKRSHWIWYIYPQQKGLGRSFNSEFYGLDGKEEAKAYLDHPVLGARLRDISKNLLKHKGSRTIRQIMGSGIDVIKLKTCMKLFDSISPNDIFAEILTTYFSKSN